MMNNVYFNPKKYLPYQRNFIFITSERTIGKTYSTQKMFIEKFLDKGERFVYYVRTQEERKNGVFNQAFMKVMSEQFSDYKFVFKGNEVYYQEDEDVQRLMGVCVSLSEANKNKRINFPKCRFGMLDEYILEGKRVSEYVDGFGEPKLFLKLYHTLDREEDYQTVFLLGNSIEFFNPYHIYPAFDIPYTPKGQIWKSENVIYEQVEASETLKKKKKKSKFLKMIDGTDYGDYAIHGMYINDNQQYIEERDGKSKLKFVFDSGEDTFGLWYSSNTGLCYVDRKYDKNFPFWFTFYTDRMGGNKRMCKGKTDFLIRWCGECFKRGLIRWPDMETKVKSMEGIKKML